MANDEFFDTNIVVYFATESGEKQRIAAKLLDRGGLVSVQVLNELASVLTGRKFKLPLSAVLPVLAAVRKSCLVVPVTLDVHTRGIEIMERYKLQLYDSMLIAAAELAGCHTMFTEDMHDGLVIGKLKFVNPFADR